MMDVNYQNKGIGTYVINNILNTINEPVMLYVFIGNEKAVSLCRRLGFKVIKNIKDSRYIVEKLFKQTTISYKLFNIGIFNHF